MSKKKILAIIPARQNSSRVKNKNIRKFHKSTLTERTILQSLKSKYISDVCVTSDSNKILEISKKYPVHLIKRPKSLSGNQIMPDSAIIHAVRKLEKKFDLIVMLQPTSPLRRTKHIDNAIKKIINDKSDSLLSVFKSHSFLWESKGNFSRPLNYNYLNRPRSQNIQQYQENGAIYITKPEILKKNKNRLGGKISIYEMNFWDSFDIDDLQDFKNVEKILKFI